MAFDFTLHHHVARPISVHYHRPIARTIHFAVMAAAIGFLIVKIWLFRLAYEGLVGSPLLAEASFLLVPFFAGVILIVALTIYGEKAFYRELTYLERKYRPQWLHSFKH